MQSDKTCPIVEQYYTTSHYCYNVTVLYKHKGQLKSTTYAIFILIGYLAFYQN